ncbi:ferrichrome siderophore peptide synthetase [Fusarium longipes]|uniref:Ferrichrome siderophore peptide synthetase n=1 Tax=Fusarium longipes TaxID=694270 RepID=A0A395T6R8_9HYPO|nr:ferrichrome siderophore peptide synthetase [Fusarium longipes]
MAPGAIDAVPPRNPTPPKEAWQTSKEISFRLPDGETNIWIANADNNGGDDYLVGSGNATLARWSKDGRETRTSPPMINDDRARFGPVLELEIFNADVDDPRSPFASHGEHGDLALTWASVYALWLHPNHRDDDLMAISIDSQKIGEYIRSTGLGVVSPYASTATPRETIYWLSHDAFWQGAGAPDSQHWLQSRPEVTNFPGFNGTMGVFASQMGFTRKGNVCTVHPVRPPKPKPGTVIYSRYIVELGQQLQIRHIDASNPTHFEAYKSWQNSDRVNKAWKERGPDEHHRNYLANQLADPHTMSCVFEWDGQLAGYTEIGWVLEDNAACFFRAGCNITVGDHDQNSHIIVGEERFRGGKRYQAVATSIKHYSRQVSTAGKEEEVPSAAQDGYAVCATAIAYKPLTSRPPGIGIHVFEPRPDRETAVKAFVKLVSFLIILDEGESFCVRDSERDGYILAHLDAEDIEQHFIQCDNGQDVPTEFSIGQGKALQLHFEANGGIRLTAQASVIPQTALQILGCTFDDILEQQNSRGSSEWSQPSVLNFPPKASPMDLARHGASIVDHSQCDAPLLHHWFERRAVESPEVMAIDYLTDLDNGGRVQFTYQQTSNVATALAAKLVELSSRSSQSLKTVAVLMGPCPELYISYLAALKAGLAFCPIPVDAPRERKEALMADLKPTAILTISSLLHSETWQGIGDASTKVVDVTPHLASRDVEPQQLPSRSTTVDDIAYILYTSGTTGLPKGVAVSHLSVSCTISSLSAHYKFTLPPAEGQPVRWFQGAAPTFDISLFEIFWTLSSGSTLCCAPRHLTLQNIDKVVTTLEADITNITPSFASLLDPSSIKGLMVGGEILNARLLQDFSQWNPTADDEATHVSRGIFNGYGPTETAIYCIAQAHIPRGQRGSVIGTPLATCGAIIVESRSDGSKSLKPVPMGAIGELVITGPQVSKLGYLNRPEEAGLVFFDDARWGRVYKTGDRARVVFDRDGSPVIEFLGRMSDDQVKLSGRRAELGEIESILASKVDFVRETMACVWKQGAEAGSEKVVSLVAVEPRTGISFENVQKQCLEVAKQHLPDYMRPFKILEVDAIPRSASGKADRKAASRIVNEAMEKDAGAHYQEPADSACKFEPLEDPGDAMLEQELLNIVRGVLSEGSTNAPVITPATVLADAGIDSLRAMRVLRDIRARWPASEGPHGPSSNAKLQPSLADLLGAKATIRSTFFPSIQESNSSTAFSSNELDNRSKLEAFSAKHLAETVDRLDLHESDVEMILPTTSTQSQLAVSFAMDKRNYISHTVLRLRSGVSTPTLKDAIDSVLSRQAIYRCAILPCDDSLSPFIQAVLTPEAWEKLTGRSRAVLHRESSDMPLSSDPQVWLDMAESELNLESHKLYHIQIIEPEDSSTCGLLIISAAHCICDGPSLEVLMNDITRQYAGLEPLARKGIYESVFDWMSNLSTDTDQLWQKTFQGWETEPLGAISGNNVRPPTAGARQHAMVQHFSDISWSVLETKSRALGASPLTILQASWAMLLHNLSEADTDDTTFGSVLSGHDDFIHAPTFSVVPCRVALPESQTLRQLIDNLMQNSRFSQAHRHTSFGLFESLPYNTALALQAYPSPDDNGNGATLWTDISNPAIRYDFAMFAEVFPTDPRSADRNGRFDNVVFKVTYRDETFSDLSTTCILKQFAALTEVMMNSMPDDLVQTLPARIDRGLLSTEGAIPVEQNLEVLNIDARETHERTQVLHAQFEDQAASTPELQALSFYSSLDAPPIELSYAELDSRANGLANVLREFNIDIIPICMERSVELYVSILAILKAGSAWCPIDTTSPVQRRTSLIARAQSKVLLTNTESLPLVEPCLGHETLKDVQVILVDRYADRKTPVRAKPRDSLPSSKITGENLAYLLWTSGTTGEPKGVMIQHSAAAQAMRDLQVQVEHDDSEQVRTLQLSAYSFDVFVQDLFYTWGLAGSVVTGTRELVLGTFTEFIWKSRPTHAHLTPSFGASIAVQELKGSTLQYVTFIGEKLTEDVAEAWADPEISTRAYNTYGPAENAVVSTMRRFYGKSRDDAKAANVGFPLNPCTAYVVREVEMADGTKRWELVPRYGVGELALGGAQVAKGYLANEAKTTKAFIQGGPGIDERIYLTGDLVRLNDHGFEFLGRNDDLVKITGIRIELSEISAACASLKEDDAAIEHVETLYLQRPGAPAENNNKVVVTFVSVKAANIDTGKIRNRVFKRAKDLLPSYMVPGHVVVLDTTMPRTASNKVDRKALQAIYAQSDLNVLSGRDDATGPQTHGPIQATQQWTEEQLKILATIASNFNIPVEKLSPEDSLAGLGLSSLQVTKLAWLLRRELQCQVGVLDLMRCESLGELVNITLSRMPKMILSQTTDATPVESSWLASIRDALTTSIKGTLRPSDTVSVLPATPMQESLIVETMLEPQAYWAHRVFDLGHLDDVDARQLKRAWTVAAKRFDILRTIFVPLTQLAVEGSDNIVSWSKEKGVQSTILQLVREKPVVRWTQLVDEQDQTLSDVARMLQSQLAPTTTVEPPWAVTFIEESNKMMLSMHHSLYDAVASDMFLEAVSKFYNMESFDSLGDIAQFDKGLELGLLPTPANRDEATKLWNRRLEDLSKTVSGGMLNAPFPDLTQSRQKQTQKILLAKKDIPDSLINSASGVSLPTRLQSSFGCVLASYLELDSIVLGHTVSQRALHPDLEHVAGPAIATLPLIVRSNVSSAEELWGYMAHDSAELFETTHNLHPVDVKRMLNRNGGGSAPFPGLFVYHPASDDDSDRSAGHMFREVGQALSLNVEHPLALNVFEGAKSIELTGDGRRISQPQLEILLDQILEQARVMMEAPKVPLFQLQNRLAKGLLSISGRAEDSEDTITNPADSVALYASQHPDWIAAEEVVFQPSEDDKEMVTKSITYAKLDKLTNAIVTQLIRHEANLQPDDPVAMCLGRDIKSLAVTLAIFRAGFIYLPVDEDLPSARKQLLIRDAGAKLVITTEELFGELQLNEAKDAPVLKLPDGEGDLDVILSSPISEHQFKPRDGGYLLYTSGSTGRPKGVRVSNSKLCHFISAFSHRLIEHSPATAKLGGVGRYLNLTSRAFDPHLTQLFVPWHLGYRVVIGKDRTSMMANLKELIDDLGITHFGSVPSVLTQLRLKPEDVPSVRVVTTGGEKASNELLNTWAQDARASDDRAVLFNFYGPTEVTIGCLGHAVNLDSNARNLGLPLHGLEAIILCRNTTSDEHIVARRGQPGELCIAGPQVAMGYLNRPVEQAKSFETVSILGDTKRIYRTGDMMRMMNDGSLEFLGRADQQTKIRGQRLELDEVVGFLKQVASSKGDFDFAATVASSGDGSTQQQQLLGFIAKKASIDKASNDMGLELLETYDHESVSLLETIEQECQAKLPAFMVPTLVWVTKIPYLAASGKVDTKLLGRLANDFLNRQQAKEQDGNVELNTGDESYLSPAEALVVAAIEEAVGINVKASPNSSIHRLGIDSLSAVNLVSLLRKRGFSHVKMTHILTASCTVGDIARLADQSASTTNSTPVSTPPFMDDHQNVLRNTLSLTVDHLGALPDGLDADNIEAVLPCLPLQSALIARSLVWLSAYDDDSEGHDVPYVAHFSYRLDKETDIDRWRRAAEQVMASEAMLRSCFIQRDEDGQIFQVVLRSPPVSSLRDTHPAEMVAQMAVQPPVRLSVLQNSDGATVTLMIHHALFDGVAIESLKLKLEQQYNDPTFMSRASSGTLKALSNVSNHCNLTGGQLEATKRSWGKELRGVQPCRVGRIDDNRTSGSMARSTLCLSCTTPQLNAKLNSASGASISTSSAFQLATSLCLAQLTQQSSIVYGFIMSLRPLLDHVADGVGSLVAPCLNTLLRTVTLQNQDETLPQLAERVHKGHLDVCQGTMPLVSVDRVQRWSSSEDKLFDSLLSINVIPSNDEENDTPKPGRLTALPTRSSSDMALAIDVDLHADGKIILTLSSSGALDERQLSDVGRLFETVLYNCADTSVKVSDIVPLLSPSRKISPTSHHNASKSHLKTHTADSEYKKALDDVKETISRLLRLSPSEVSSKPDTTSLYQLGLDSITVLPFVKHINKSNKTKLSSHAVIKARTIKGVAELLQEARMKHTSTADCTHTAVVPIEDSTLSDGDVYDKTLARLAKDLMFVATPLQEGMLSASLATGGNAYTYVHTIQLSDAALGADTPILDNFLAAVKDTVQACEILRTRFIFTDDEGSPWVGIVSPTEQSDLVSWEVNPTPRGRVHLRIHHALYDATSIQAVWHILEESYARRLRGDISQLNNSPKYLFRPFAKTVASSQRVSIAFWADAVQDYTYTPLNFPTDELKASSAFHFSLGEKDLLHLQSICKKLGVTIKAALQLAWVKVLCESLYHQADAVYGEVVSTDADDDVAIVGPTINTLPMRANLGAAGDAITVSRALGVVQRQIDSGRGANSMASLRKVQTQWRSNQRGDTPAGLFQSLFVFDGLIGSAHTADTSLPLFSPAETTSADSTGPAYDDYPLIVSFRIKDNQLNGKLRAKMSEKEVKTIGTQLVASLQHILHESDSPILDDRCLRVASNTASANPGVSPAAPADMNGMTPTADAVLDIVGKVIGTRRGSKRIGYDTRLISVGLDSILAIRLSKLLKDRVGLSVSVFEFMKGASVRDIVTRSSLTRKPLTNKAASSAVDDGLKTTIAKDVGISDNLIKSILPALSGQKSHLQQWVHNGKRFFEPPWVYRVKDSVNKEKVTGSWAELVRKHDILRTTFWCHSKTGELFQVTLSAQWPTHESFAAVQDLTMTIEALIHNHVSEGNVAVSDLKSPPVRLSFLEGSDGKAVVLRLHHALYDGWSIKMIEKDLDQLLTTGEMEETRPSLQHLTQRIEDIRDTDAETKYWEEHLSRAEETFFSTKDTTMLSPFGPQLKATFSAGVSKTTIDLFSQKSQSQTSTAIILAYARTLEQMTQKSNPTFGLNHASRSLSSLDGAQTLDLTDASIPTLTITPFSMDLKAPLESQIGFIQDHLAQLTCFAQADDLPKISPKFDSYLNIIRRNDAMESKDNGSRQAGSLHRYRLPEPLASSYFTVMEASSSASTVDKLDTSHMCAHRLFFNVIVSQQEGVKITVTVDEGYLKGNDEFIDDLVGCFGDKLEEVMKVLD